MHLPLVYHPSYSYEFPEQHRFAMVKFRYLHDYLRQRGIATTDNLYRSGPCLHKWLLQAHCPDYLTRLREGTLSHKEQRELGLPWTPGLAKRTFISPGGTLLTALLAMRYGVACHLAGGTHHAHYDKASGFCCLNDLAVTALAMLEQPGIERVLVFDCDVHQGDGTAAILAARDDAFTCSIHCEKNFPARKQLSNLDVGLVDGIEDEAYLQIVMETLQQCLDRVRPDLVLYDAGVDVFAGDPLGRACISEEGIARRDRQVLGAIRERNIPVATVIGGGYDDDRWALARRHAIVVEQALALQGSQA
ncbi:histone deacetylase family protein [Aestuariirhabdus litorea]|uniref:Histone deacetylase n=1 Tax=Aestuariirhabdus litorea TaxID=2528527 RepID=A0A3P3VPV2_9GAMM|nr:histone deacetylase [Aestuariirhabdus litorea]RRJ83619.1 histone deacetylase [Aestuariirhabdus litorea]RWW96840.1 histone deacetylase [Endozoicomonadaceae bacterium GTF-13]